MKLKNIATFRKFDSLDTSTGAELDSRLDRSLA